eukprot:5479511-Amphidinium_carterae.5
MEVVHALPRQRLTGTLRKGGAEIKSTKNRYCHGNGRFPPRMQIAPVFQKVPRSRQNKRQQNVKANGKGKHNCGDLSTSPSRLGTNGLQQRINLLCFHKSAPDPNKNHNSPPTTDYQPNLKTKNGSSDCIEKIESSAST